MRLVLACCFVFSLCGTASAEGFWGRRLPDQPTQFIFGYGSLINTASRNSTASKPTIAIPVRVSADFGYIRSWNDRAGSGFTALGLRRPADGEAAMTINGVLYGVEGDDMSAFDARERNYTRVEVPLSQIEPVSWQRPPESGHVWVYVPVVAGQPPGVGLRLPSAEFPMVQSYIDVVIEGGLEYGPDFAREIIATTKDWSEYWLNDRPIARRPWVYDPKSSAVDRLLRDSLPEFAARQFEEPYAIKYLSK